MVLGDPADKVLQLSICDVMKACMSHLHAKSVLFRATHTIERKTT